MMPRYGFVALPLLALFGCSDREMITVPSEGSRVDLLVSQKVVTKLADSDDGVCDADCSLHEAIEAAAAGDEITFAAGLTGTITLTSILPFIDKNLTITGPGAASLSVNGYDTRPVFEIYSATVSISGLTITGSDAGGIFNNGTLTLTNVTVSGNRAFVGAGIYNSGYLTLTGSTVSDNHAITEGGGLFNNTGGGDQGVVSGSMTLVNSTVSGNTAGTGGGGIASGGPLTLINSTVSDNSAGSAGGGLAHEGGLLLSNSLVAGNSASSAPDVKSYLFIDTVVWYSLIGSPDGNAITSATTEDGTMEGNIVGVRTAALRLRPLADNGGPTRTHALLLGSLAVDAAPCTDNNGNTVLTDQRGITRPQGQSCDMGAFEYERSGQPEEE